MSTTALITLVVGGNPGKMNTVTLGWDQVPGALYYKIFRGTTSGGPYKVIGYSNPVPGTGTGTPAINSFTDGPNTLDNGPYYYVVSTVTIDGESSYSAEYIASPPIQPTAPFNLTAVIT